MSRLGRRGQALAEFAIVLPMFLILLFGLIDLGRYVYAANAVSNASREGARVGSVMIRPNECSGLDRQACVEAIAAGRSWGLPSDSISVTVACDRFSASGAVNPVAVSTCRTNDLLTVTAATPFTLITPLIAQFVGEFTVQGESSIAVNQ